MLGYFFVDDIYNMDTSDWNKKKRTRKTAKKKSTGDEE